MTYLYCPHWRPPPRTALDTTSDIANPELTPIPELRYCNIRLSDPDNPDRYHDIAPYIGQQTYSDWTGYLEDHGYDRDTVIATCRAHGGTMRIYRRYPDYHRRLVDAMEHNYNYNPQLVQWQRRPPGVIRSTHSHWPLDWRYA